MRRFAPLPLCAALASPALAGGVAPGAPGERPTWTNGDKQGVGTSATLESKAWFTLGDGALTETYYPTLDRAQTRLLELVVVDAAGRLERETAAAARRVEAAAEGALAFRQINEGRAFRITKTTFTDPERAAVLIRVRFERLTARPLRLFVFFDPAVGNSGLHDSGYTTADALVAEDAGTAVALLASCGFRRTHTGYLGTSDGLAALAAGQELPAHRRSADGNVAQMAEIPLAAGRRTAELTLALGFGSEGADAIRTARESLRRPAASLLAAYVEGWRDYLATLRAPRVGDPRVFATAAMVLRAFEDKTHRGAMIASLTKPWGHEADAGEPDVGGYHLVWSRDLYHVATAFQALGDKGAADRALQYLFETQQRPDGSFPQNSWLDGRPYWPSLQLDEVAYPLILAWQLGRSDGATYHRHVRPAAEFLLAHGPATPQERWEEEGGYSPSTLAAEIAGLVCAAAIAERNGDGDAARRYRERASWWAAQLDAWTAARGGPLSPEPYYIRIAQDGRPDSGARLEINNGGGSYDEREIVDAGFLELVRLGIRPAADPLIVASLRVVDRVIRVETPQGPGWYRYNHDGYGEKPDGRGYDGTGVGRLWPILTGERGEYELAAGRDARPYLETLARFANAGGMLPEQVWDRADAPTPALRFGAGTGSATPLAWSCAQYVRLAIAIEEGRVVEMPEVVRRHFAVRP